MLNAYVCRQCRIRLSRQIAPVRNTQRQSRATFFSLRRSTTQDEAESAKPTAQPQEQSEATDSESQGRPPSHYIKQARAVDPQQRPGRYSRHVQDDAGSERQPATEQQGGPESFSRVSAFRRPGIFGQRLSSSREERHDSIANAVEPAGPACQIKNMLSNGRRVNRAWKIFQENYTSKDCQALTEPHPDDVLLLLDRKVFVMLLEAVNRAYCNGVKDLEVTPTMLLFRLDQLGLASPEFWDKRTLLYLTHHAIVAINSPQGESSVSVEHLLSELLSVWRLFFQLKGLQKVPLDSVSSEWNLPAPADLPDMFEEKVFPARLQEIHPAHMKNAIIGFCAVYLFTLSGTLKSNEVLRKEAEPFILILRQLLAGSFVNQVYLHTQHSALFNKLSDEVKEEVIRKIDAAPKNALRELGVKNAALENEDLGDPAANLEAYHLKRMARAIQSRQSADILDRLWEDALKDFQKDGKPAIPPRIYNSFLKGFMVLLRAQRSVEVWNHMIKNDVKPDTQSWVALLEGCAKAGDRNGFDAMWTRMLNAGVEPDNYAWTTRVHGLLAMRQPDRGLGALDEMSNRWLSAENPQASSGVTKGTKKSRPSAKTTVNTSTKPSIEVVNAAITGIVQLNAKGMRHEKCVDYVQKILGWAASFEIKADAITYNSLIRLYLRSGDTSTAFSILNQMERSGIEADVATHNILITAAFDNASFSELSETEQMEKVVSLFDSLEKSGLELNEYVYSTAIDKLLKMYSNYSAAHVLLTRMRANNLVPNAHICTSLITYYFQQEPPVISAVDAIIDQVFNSQRIPTDRYLFDRTLEGYAAHNEIGRLMVVLTRMSKHNRIPGFRALTSVVEALMRDGDIERARSIVRDVERGEGIAKGGVTGGKQGEATFFATVKGFGIGLEQERMGDMWSIDRAQRASGDDAVLGYQLREQEIQQIVQSEEAQEMDALPERNIRVRLEGETESEREPGVVEDEEDVHGFLRDDHQDVHSRV